MRKLIKRWLKRMIEEILSEGITCHAKATEWTVTGHLSLMCEICGRLGIHDCKSCIHYGK